MSEITSRERFLATMRFEKPDRLPFCEFAGFWDETLTRWHKEGLPIVMDQQESMLGGILNISGGFQTMDYRKYFGLEKIGFYLGENIPIDFGPIPRFVPRTLEENDRYRILVDEGGITKRVIKSKTFSMPQFIDWPVKTRENFEKIKTRFNPADPRRYPKTWSDELIEYYEALDHPVGLFIEGFYAHGRQLMGTVPFVALFYKDPEFIHEMMNFHADFIVENMRKAVEALKSRIDYVFWHEDMAYKHGPHVSPKLFREFMLPGYKKVTSFLRRNGIDIILLDSDGDLRPLIPLLLEGGINGLTPLEVCAGMDAIALRKEYGKRLCLIGNIDKRALVAGRTAIEKEVEYKLPYLKEKGGYIPSLDHLVSPDIPYENYLYYLNFLKKFL